MQQNLDLTQKAILVSLHVRKWGARKVDQAATQKVLADNGIHDTRTGWFNKRLIDQDELNEIKRIEGESRQFHYKMTLPWGDNGFRLLPIEAYFDYVAGITKLQDDYNHAVSNFLQRYDDAIRAAKHQLNGLFREEDYPSKEQLERKFQFDLEYSQLPSDDVRVNLSQKDKDKISKDIQDRMQSRLQEAHRDLYFRLLDMVSHFAETMKNPDKKFKDTTVTKVQEMVDIAPKLNIYQDKELDRIVGKISDTWALFDPDDLRQDKEVRAEVAESAENTVKNIEQAMAGVFK